MICVMLELGGLTLQKKIHGEQIFPILNEIKSIFIDKKHCLSIEDGNYLLFVYKEPEYVVSKFNAIIDQLEKLFELKQDIMQGNVVYIHSCQKVDIRSLFEDLKKRILMLPNDKGFFYSKEFKQSYKSLCNYRQTHSNSFDEKSLYGMSIIQKRELLSSLIIYAKEIINSILPIDEIKRILNKEFLQQPIFKNIQIDVDELLQHKISHNEIDRIEKKIGYQGLQLRTIFTKIVYMELLNVVPINSIEEYGNFFIRWGEGEYRLPAIFYLIKAASLCYNLELSKELESLFLRSDNSKEQQHHLYLVKLMIRYYQALICCDYDEISNLQKQILSSNAPNSIYLRMERDLLLSDSFLCCGDANSSLTYSKEVIFELKNGISSYWFSTNANFLLAHGMLTKNRSSEADIYFKFAAENSLRLGFFPLELLSVCARILISFLKGSFDSCHTLLDSILSKYASSSLISPFFKIYFEFLRMRILFEEGAYDEIAKVIDKLIGFCQNHSYSVGVNLFSAWKGRIFIYLGKITKGLTILSSLRPSFETLVFEAEGYYFSKGYEKGYEKLLAACDYIETESRFISPYINLFRNSFINYEDRIISYSQHQTSFTFYYYGLKVLFESALKIEKNMLWYKTKLRDELMPKGDPSNRIYCYLLAKAYENLHSYATELEQLALINRSYKYLQEYSGMTLEPTIRMNYLNRNVWNIEIQNMAKKFKL